MTEIVLLTQDSLDAIKPIENASHRFPWTDKVLASNFGQRYFNYQLMIEGEVVGFYFANHVAGEASLLNIAIDPAYQGQGYGRLLLNHFIDVCKELDLYQAWLEVRESNISAYNLYLNIGFNEVDRRFGYYPAESGREDAIMMCYIV